MSYIFNIELLQQINKTRKCPTHLSEDSSEVRCDLGRQHAPLSPLSPNLCIHLFTGWINTKHVLWGAWKSHFALGSYKA